VLVLAAGSSVIGPAASARADATSPPGTSQFNPCSLVSVQQMRAITRLHVVKRTLAPLGPTCIYTFTKRSPEITVAVAPHTLSLAARHMAAPKRVSIERHQALCGRLGEQTLLVSLPHGQVLTIVAGCATARKIAAVALVHLKS
jgi:hypothetical protein